jgi:hypothetical protein
MNINAHNKDRDCRAQGWPAWPPSESRPRAASKSPAWFPASQAGFTRLAHATKKPISGKPEIGAQSAQFLSFNFPNNLICAVASSLRVTRTQ